MYLYKKSLQERIEDHINTINNEIEKLPVADESAEYKGRLLQAKSDAYIALVHLYTAQKG